MPFDPDKYLAKKTKPTSGFDPDAYLAGKAGGDKDETASLVKSNFKPSALESFGAGGAQGLLMDFFDEAYGAAKSPLGAVKKVAGLIGYDTSNDKDVAAYNRERDTARQAFAAAREVNPKSYVGGQIGGSVAGALAPGTQLAKVGRATRLASGAAMGGAYGLGSSEGETLSEQAADVATGAGIGLGGGLIAEAGSAVIPKLIPKAKAVTSTVKNAIAGDSDESIAQTGKRLAQSIFGKSKPVENASQVAKAVQDISGKSNVPNYLLTDDRTKKILADTLLKSPTIGGAQTRAELAPIYEGLENFGKEVASRASTLSQNETGQLVRSGVQSRFKQLIAPAEEIYEGLEKQFSKVPLEKRAFKNALTKLKSKYKTDFTGSSQKLIDNIEQTVMGTVDDTGKQVGGINTVEELRNFRTNLGKYLSGTSSDAEKAVIGELYGVATRERDRSILRSTIGKGKIGRSARNASTLKDLKKADKIYRKGLLDVSDALGVEGSSKQSTRTAINEYLSSTNPEKIVKDLFNKGNVEKFQKVKSVFPEEFDLLVKNYVSEVVDKSSTYGKLDPARLVRTVSKLPPEVRSAVLGELESKAKSAELVLGALPKDFNPSHTAHAMSWKDIFSPSWYAQNVQSLPQRAILTKGSPSAKEILNAKKGLLP